ncbi:MAG: entericidin A/B family lipoprotein [Burkholderiales bacterium]|jgi:entericidin B|nr:entericidin A/B family lipoprotein [Burkholderiales bacterium]MCW5575224.1 entericidin A/B family lipoprotein [Burkholderiales bacterium]
MKRVIMLMVAMLVLAGCNTVAGVGKDVEKAGEAIQRSTK